MESREPFTPAAPIGPPSEYHPPLAPGDDPFARVRDLLARARSRQRRLILLAAACWAALGLLAAAALAVGLAAAGVGLARPLLLVAALAAAAGFVWAGPLRAHRQVGDLASTARLLASQLSLPALRRGLLPALELGRALEAGDRSFSPALARAHIESVAYAAASADLSEALPDRPLRRALRALGAAALVCAVAGALFSSAAGRGLRRLAAATGAPAAPSRAAEPVTGEIELTYVYPAHTRLAPKTVPNTNGDISAPRGTQVRVQTRADRPVDRAFVLLGDSAVPFEVRNGRDLSGTLLVSQPGSYRFRFLDSRGRVLVEGPPIPIAVEADTPPKVEILSPATEVEVDPRSSVGIRFEAEDDYGLSEVALVYKLPGATRSTRVLLRRPADAPRRAQGEHTWDILPLGLLAGDRVAYYLEAIDNDEVSGRKTGVSRTQFLKIYSEVEHRRELLRRVQGEWEKLILLLADRLEAPDRALPGRTLRALQGQSEVDARSLALASTFSDLSRELRKQKAPDPLWRALANAGSGLGRRAQATASARASLLHWMQRGGRQHGSPHRAFETALQEEIAEQEQVILYLEALLDQQRIADLLELSRELAAKRRELGDLLERYRTAPDEATRERLQMELARLKERMAQLLGRMAELSRGIQDEHVNAEALEEMNESGKMMDAFDRIQDLINRDQVEEAMKEMEKLGEMLDSLQQNLHEASQQFRGGELGEVAQQLQELANQLQELEREQQQVLEETQQVRSSLKKAFERRVAQRGESFVEKLRKKAAEARKRLEAVEDPHNPFIEPELRAVREDLGDLDRALSVRDFDQAKQSTLKSLERARRIADEMGRQAQQARHLPPAFRDRAEQAERNQANAQAAVPPLQEIQRALDELMPEPGQALGERDRQKLQELAERQRALEQQTGELGQKMSDINSQAPLFSPDAQQMLQEAGQAMGQAQRQLRGNNPTGAAAEERAALDHLAQLKRGLEQQPKQGGAGGGMAVPWPFRSPGDDQGPGSEMATDQKVQIPGAEQYQVPEEYRKDILDAMKQPSPDRYREQVKRYYEEIVK